jgi:hypothetical protein
MAKKDEKALVVREELTNYPILAEGAEKFREVIEANFGGSMTISLKDLDRIKWPGSGSTTFEVPSLEGDVPMKSLAGIIVEKQEQRAYWEEEFEGGNEPPQCSSLDCTTGIGDPGGNCDECPYSQWGSGKGNAQACKHMMMIFLLMENEFLPKIVIAPPTSMSIVRKFLVRLSGRLLPHHRVISVIDLEKVQSQGGIDYARAIMSIQKDSNGKPLILEGEELKNVEMYTKSIQEALKVQPAPTAWAEPVEEDDDGNDTTEDTGNGVTVEADVEA